jgi:hypothetical protein
MNDATFLESSSPSGMEEKWGKSVLDAGWTGIPNALLKYAGPLGLDPAETLTLIYLMRFWWRTEDLPYPSISKTSLEMGVSRKTMTKKFASLREKGYIAIVKQGGRTKFSLAGLRKALEQEHKAQREVSKTKKADVIEDDISPF